jgi:hypothetical protein
MTPQKLPGSAFLRAFRAFFHYVDPVPTTSFVLTLTP